MGREKSDSIALWLGAEYTLGREDVMIEEYAFGRMVIDGAEYRKDVIILPDGSILSPWWRQEGHRLAAEDIEQLLAASPDTIIVGIGSPGMMSVDPALIAALEAKGIRLIIEPTRAAADTFNSLASTNPKTAACFHLTC